MSPLAVRRTTLPWTGAPLAELVRLAWPIAVSTLSYSAMNLVDVLFVGRLGSDALAGVGLAGTLSFALVCFSIGLLRAVKVLVSQSVGAAQAEQADGVLGAGIICALALGVVSIGAAQLVAPLLQLISATAEAGGHAQTYLRIRMWSAPMLLTYVALREGRYGRGDSRTPMLASLIGNLLNIALDYLLIVHAGLGVAGAAWATTLAHTAEALVVAWAQIAEGFGFRAVRPRHFAALCRIGIPSGLQMALEVGAFVMLAVLISALSATEMAAHQVALNVVHVSVLPAFAVAEATSVLIGQAVGADRDDLVLPVARMALVVTAFYTGLCTIAFCGFAPGIAGLFTDDIRVQQAAASLLLVAAAFQIADAANMVARGALRGTGDVRAPAVIGTVTAWAMTPPLTWLLGYRFGLGALGGWIGLCVEIIAGASLLWWRLRWGGWRRAAEFSRRELRNDSTNSL
jgi:multidrug resistance protein, MATE family